ncbi:MAG TPA: hypothetical protein VMU73_10365, partial [Gaiellaceae bacterium]|nr:hypothetical protein [Gaiellaceae bacterium]
MTTTAASVARDDAFVRDARERNRRDRLGDQARFVYAGWSSVAVAGAISALWLHGGPAFTVWKFALFALLYALVSRVEFEIGNGSAIPTQLVLAPMLFAIPIGAVPLTVMTGLLLRSPGIIRRPAKALPILSSAAHALGPTLVVALAGGLPLRWSAWLVYVAALFAQFAFDLGYSVIGGLANRITARTVIGFLWLIFMVDAALAPVGLVLAFAARHHAAFVLLALPLVGLLQYFSRERQHRIDNALELSDAYRGTAFLLGDVVEADDA